MKSVSRVPVNILKTVVSDSILSSDIDHGVETCKQADGNKKIKLSTGQSIITNYQKYSFQIQ